VPSFHYCLENTVLKSTKLIIPSQRKAISCWRVRVLVVLAKIHPKCCCSVARFFNAHCKWLERCYGARNPCLWPYLWSVPAATKPAILIMTSLATGHAQRYGRTDALPCLKCIRCTGTQPWAVQNRLNRSNAVWDAASGTFGVFGRLKSIVKHTILGLVGCAKTSRLILTIYMSCDVFAQGFAVWNCDDCTCVKILMALIFLIAINSWMH